MDRAEVAQIARDEIARSLVVTSLRQNALVGPFSADSGSLAAGSSAVITFTHNAGMLGYRVLAEPLDAGFGYFVNWIVTARAANTVTIAFLNGGPVAAELQLEYFLKPVM